MINFYWLIVLSGNSSISQHANNGFSASMVNFGPLRNFYRIFCALVKSQN